MTKDQVTLKDVEAASKRLAGVVHKTPLEQDRLKYVELQIVFRP